MQYITEPAREVPIVHECDICVIGGSCTGVFAAIRAARLGARVAIVEKQNCFGGVATISMVNAWHSLLDTEFERQIIADHRRSDRHGDAGGHQNVSAHHVCFGACGRRAAGLHSGRK
jgi:flavin-dependent dehydrogenase